MRGTAVAVALARRLASRPSRHLRGRSCDLAFVGAAEEYCQLGSGLWRGLPSPCSHGVCGRSGYIDGSVRAGRRGGPQVRSPGAEVGGPDMRTGSDSRHAGESTGEDRSYSRPAFWPRRLVCATSHGHRPKIVGCLRHDHRCANCCVSRCSSVHLFAVAADDAAVAADTVATADAAVAADIIDRLC